IDKLKGTLLFSFRVLFFILVPSSIGLMVLSAPITRTLFERGAFGPYSTGITADALFFYAIGLLACGGIKILVSVFYSLKDTLTPVKVAAVSLVLNIILNIVLMAPLRASGLALATSLAAIFNCVALYRLLRRKIGPLGIGRITDSLIKVTTAGLAMGLFCYYLSARLNVIFNIALGCGVYFLASLLLGSSEIKEFSSWILRKR
ncbi:MAG: lipid II flippase MurJ, partial [Candidatus Omnitrophota bacterium]